MHDSLRDAIRDGCAADPGTVGEILTLLAHEASDIGQHVNDNWQDRKGARGWDRIAGAIERARAAFDQWKPY